MKTWSPFLCLLAMLTFAQANPNSDDVLKRACAQRLQQQYGLTLEPGTLSLAAFQEIEARLAVCFRLKAKLRQLYDYRTTSLAFLQDLESRWDACERIQQKYNVLLRHEYYTAAALADLEKRLGVASHIYQTYGREVNWRDNSLQQLQTTERQLAAVQTPLATPHTQPLATSAVVFRSGAPTPAPPPVEVDSTASADTGSYAYQPSYSASYASQSTYTPSYSTLLSSPVPQKTTRRVTSAPVFYDSGYNYNAGYGYGYGYGYNGYRYYAPCYPTASYGVPTIPSVPYVPPLIRLW